VKLQVNRTFFKCYFCSGSCRNHTRCRSTRPNCRSKFPKWYV